VEPSITPASSSRRIRSDTLGGDKRTFRASSATLIRPSSVSANKMRASSSSRTPFSYRRRFICFPFRKKAKSGLLLPVGHINGCYGLTSYKCYDGAKTVLEQGCRGHSTSCLVRRQRCLPLPWAVLRCAAVSGPRGQRRCVDPHRLCCRGFRAVDEAVADTPFHRPRVAALARRSWRMPRGHEHGFLSRAR